ncbi:MAG: hypothetical protein Q9169_003398 [Polycauliona sp. 2 TL-2023]
MPQPRNSVSHRPQTSRQAKRAYQKAGGTPRISAAEQRRIDRAVELEDRAARIRLHNVRARENKRKKAEKDERDRELRKRTGEKEPSKFRVGPSQLSLGTFVAVGSKRKKPEPVKVEVADWSSPYTPTETTKTKNILDCPNMPEISKTPERVKIETAIVPSEPLKNGCNFKHTTSPQNSVPPPKVDNTTTVPLTTLMPPPPPPRLSSKPVVSKATIKCTAPSKPIVAAAPLDTDWDMFLDSDTQVEREISYQPTKLPMYATIRQPNSTTTTPTTGGHCVAPVDLLAGISTQDLQYCSSPVSSKSEHDDDTEFLAGIEDDDLSEMNVAALFECSDQAGAAVTPPPATTTSSDQLAAAVPEDRWSSTYDASKSGFYDATAKGKDPNVFSRIDEFDDYEFSSQELRQLVV